MLSSRKAFSTKGLVSKSPLPSLLQPTPANRKFHNRTPQPPNSDVVHPTCQASAAGTITAIPTSSSSSSSSSSGPTTSYSLSVSSTASTAPLTACLNSHHLAPVPERGGPNWPEADQHQPNQQQQSKEGEDQPGRKGTKTRTVCSCSSHSSSRKSISIHSTSSRSSNSSRSSSSSSSSSSSASSKASEKGGPLVNQRHPLDNHFCYFSTSNLLAAAGDQGRQTVEWANLGRQRKTNQTVSSALQQQQTNGHGRKSNSKVELSPRDLPSVTSFHESVAADSVATVIRTLPSPHSVLLDFGRSSICKEASLQ
ncbi:hypothetical protein TYRP_020912 [Tyrophagus putrescentiae]|nr:hypothetical protein TYRP_020912 [Tyrophagus putrescentiae]